MTFYPTSAVVGAADWESFHPAASTLPTFILTVFHTYNIPQFPALDFPALFY